MISSEVQRTLVKSPPELWAELSDPAALARHLGELGEIRITRVEPEQLVEWEAENRNGTVQIRPSGWGTKVTLTVATEVPDASPADEADEPAPLAVTGPAAPAEDEPAAAAVTEPASAAEEGAGAPEESVEAPEESVPSRLGAPVTAAAASSWRADSEAIEADELDSGWIAEDAEVPAPEQAADEEDGEDHEWLPYDEPEPRRGFLARLFGRWRRPQAVEADVAEDPGAPAPHAAAVAGMDASDADPVDGTAASGADAVQASADEIVPEGELPDPDAAPATPEAPIEMTPSEAASADELEPVREAAAPVADAAASESEAGSLGAAPLEQVGDIAAELKAAEETEDAEVTAVLTSVLDRLGAAHHRPFSRS
ncbi:MAG TPA: hypothetical protein VHY83_10820 [Solirubrobacteraceae bacterium]|jgi:hypothetical protein|nr:hypothetical protein [Solirubrobacteraceae bacterium]